MNDQGHPALTLNDKGNWMLTLLMAHGLNIVRYLLIFRDTESTNLFREHKMQGRNSASCMICHWAWFIVEDQGKFTPFIIPKPPGICDAASELGKLKIFDEEEVSYCWRDFTEQAAPLSSSFPYNYYSFKFSNIFSATSF